MGYQVSRLQKQKHSGIFSTCSHYAFSVSIYNVVACGKVIFAKPSSDQIHFLEIISKCCAMFYESRVLLQELSMEP